MSTAPSKMQWVTAGPKDLREKDDYYPTPPHATEALLRVETFSGAIWEPACGAGDISRALEAAGHDVASTDLVDRGFGTSRIDFLMETKLQAPNVVTNPPFKMADDFARHAMDLGADKIAMLLRINFLEGVTRRDVLEKLSRVWVFSKRLTMTIGRTDAKGGMIAYAWYVWDRAHTGKPELGWL